MNQSLATKADKKDKPAYVQPKVQVMSEKEVLNTFQVTQAMATWWVAGC